MFNPITRLFGRNSQPDLEPEHTEPVTHDIVVIDGKELTADDPEEGQ